MRSSTAAEIVVVGSGPVALAASLFAARRGYGVRLLARSFDHPPAVEAVPAPLLALLLELGVLPRELEVEELCRDSASAWASEEMTVNAGRARAHIERSALVRALLERARTSPSVAIEAAPAGWRSIAARGRVAGACRVLDATGRSFAKIVARHGPPRPWVATTATVPRHAASARFMIRAAPTGYAYRLGSDRHLTIGWVSPSPAPRSEADLRAALLAAGAGEMLEGTARGAAVIGHRIASAALPVHEPGTTPIGDAALARDALASQGLAIGMSDALHAIESEPGGDQLRMRIATGAEAHLSSLLRTLRESRYAEQPTYAEYIGWIVSFVSSGSEARATRWLSAQ